jgi:hypothetical protein
MGIQRIFNILVLSLFFIIPSACGSNPEAVVKSPDSEVLENSTVEVLERNTLVPTLESTHEPSPTTGISFEIQEEAKSSCRELFGYWDNIEADFYNQEFKYTLPMLRNIPEEVTNSYYIWDLLDSLNLIITLGNQRIPIDPGYVVVIDDLFNLDKDFDPYVSEMTELINHDLEFNSDYKNLNVCIFRGQLAAKQCTYNFPGKITKTSWTNTAYIFAVDTVSGETAHIDTLVGEIKECPHSIDSDEYLISPTIDDDQIINALNDFKESISNRSVPDQNEHIITSEPRLFINLFLFSDTANYLILIKTKLTEDQVIPFLIEPKLELIKKLDFGLEFGNEFSYIAIQEVDILDASAWKTIENEEALISTLTKNDQYYDRNGIDFQTLKEPVILMEDGILMLDPIMIQDFKSSVEPAIWIDRLD